MHFSVLSQEVLEFLNPQPNQNFIDCTINGGGHSRLILEKIKPRGKVLGIEADPEIFKEIKKQERLIPVNDNFVNLKEIVEREKFFPVSGILFDLGFSTWQIEKSDRGFSFSRDEFLDMRYSPEKQTVTAWEIVNRRNEKELTRIFKEYGEERFSKIISQRIIEKRKEKTIDRTSDLVQIIQDSIPARFQRNKINPATRTFQALRIEVNQEIENLEKVLPQAKEVLGHQGRIVVISFHSLEDRIVKHFFKNNQELEILTKRPITAGEDEIKRNPASRSAKLRTAIKK
jgi:16S rRNA (cytosine1402-N4)-methyltransferase